VPDRVKPPFCSCWHPGTLALSPFKRHLNTRVSCLQTNMQTINETNRPHIHTHTTHRADNNTKCRSLYLCGMLQGRWITRTFIRLMGLILPCWRRRWTWKLGARLYVRSWRTFRGRRRSSRKSVRRRSWSSRHCSRTRHAQSVRRRNSDVYWRRPWTQPPVSWQTCAWRQERLVVAWKRWRLSSAGRKRHTMTSSWNCPVLCRLFDELLEFCLETRRPGQRDRDLRLHAKVSGTVSCQWNFEEENTRENE